MVQYNWTYVSPNFRIQRWTYGGTVKVADHWSGVGFQPNIPCAVVKTYGANYPNWRELLKTHQGAVTSMLVTETSVSILGTARWSARSPYATAQNSGNVCKAEADGHFPGVTANQIPDKELVVHVDNLARMEFLKNLRGRYNALSGGVVLGEVKETLRLILRPGEAVVRLTERLRRDAIKAKRKSHQKNVKKAASQEAKAFSDAWLTYAFGIRPLLGDIDDGMKALSRILNPADQPQYYKITGKSGSISSSLNSSTNSTSLMFARRRTKTTEISVSSKYYGELDRRYGGFTTTSGQLGLSFLDIVPTAWELIPFSFLLDYFSNVGDVLELITVPQTGMRWTASGRVITVDTHYKDVLTGPATYWPHDWICESFEDAHLRARGRYLTRVPNVGYIAPRFEGFRVEPFLQSWKKQLNVLALTVSKGIR